MKRDKAAGKRNDELSNKLSQFYSIFPWPEDPESQQGKIYFDATLENMSRLLDHPWMTQAISIKRKVKILEICGGTGFGGVALARVLSQKGVNVSLLVTDLRKEALGLGRKWGSNILGSEVQTQVVDVREVHKLRKKFDIVLMYGLSTPHFNPWDMVQIFASVGQSLNDDGLFVIDESDRRYHIFMVQGYKWSYAEGDDDQLALSFHTGYDPIKGASKRTFLNVKDIAKPVSTDIFWWGLAEIGAFLWTFFADVDFMTATPRRHFILATRPRRLLKPKDLRTPTVCENR
jgi:SAM-dependent methyltransferase